MQESLSAPSERAAAVDDGSGEQKRMHHKVTASSAQENVVFAESVVGAIRVEVTELSTDTRSVTLTSTWRAWQ